MDDMETWRARGGLKLQRLSIQRRCAANAGRASPVMPFVCHPRRQGTPMPFLLQAIVPIGIEGSSSTHPAPPPSWIASTSCPAVSGRPAVAPPFPFVFVVCQESVHHRDRAPTPGPLTINHTGAQCLRYPGRQPDDRRSRPRASGAVGDVRQGTTARGQRQLEYLGRQVPPGRPYDELEGSVHVN
ncbi:hypothetical protein BGW80DRAFT_169156 [Lactifluus volemus]|nr:hypothetical protein BGW80DRAFT_169156 [Lactifluus volemus]